MDDLIESTLRETTFQYFLNLPAVPVFVLDPEQNIIHANNALKERLNGSANGVKGGKCFHCLHHSNERPVNCLYPKVLADGKECTFEIFVEAFNEWQTVTLTPQYNQQGKIVGAIHTMRNIVQRTSAEVELMEHSDFHRKLFNMKHGFAYCRMIFENGKPSDFIYLMVNKALESLTGLVNVVGKKVSEVVPNILESDPKLLQIYGRVAMTGEPESFEVFVNALEMWFSISVYSPEREYFVAVFDVITDRKKAEISLYKSEERYKSLFHNNNAVFLLIHPATGMIMDANPAACLYYGWSKNELCGKRISEINTLSENEIAKEMQAAREQRRKHFLFKHRLSNGEIREVEVHSIPIESDGTILLFSIVHDITDRIKAENALKESMANISAVINATDESILLLSADEILLNLNEVAAMRMGVSRAEVIGLRLEELMPPSIIKQRQPFFETVLRTGAKVSFEDERDGHFLLNHLYPILDEDKNVARVAVFSRDITDRKRTEQALVSSDRRLRQTIDISPVAMVMSISDGEITYLNQAFVQTFGYTASDIPTMDAWWKMALPDPGYRQRVLKRWSEQLAQVTPAGGGFYPLEITVKCEDATDKVVQATVTVFNDNGLENQLTVFFDITRMKHTEDAMRKAIWRLESVIEGTRAGTWEWNVQTGETIFNDYWAQMLGYSLEELGPVNIKTWESLIHPDDLLQSNDLLRAHFSGNLAFYDYECRMKHKDGHWVWVNDRGRLTSRTSDGKPLMMFGTHTDITQYKQIEENIRNLNETLEARVAERTNQLEVINNELKFHLSEIEQFTYIATHDLQEPLRTISTFSNLIREEFAGILTGDGDKYVKYMSDSATRMSKLVKGLLDYSLLGKVSRMEVVDCNEMVIGILGEMAGVIDACGARVTLGKLPVITGLSDELRILFRNLLSNAVKFQKQEIHPEIVISAERGENEWIFAIADNGIGIEAKDREKIFIIFKRMQKQSDFIGTGIGLAYCKKIVELHHGRIWVECNHDAGSVFYFTIPQHEMI
ncbi:MAG: PAS domain-containing sensor histidine kinase [Bacteroidales bacterium]